MLKSDIKSKGLGDSIAKLTHTLGIDRLAEKVAHALGEEDCGCDRRRKKLNELMTYVDVPRENYIFTESKLFEVLDCITVEGATYQAGEKILVDPSRPIYYHLKSLLIEEKIKLC